MPTPAGYKIWEQTAAVTVASSPVVSGWYDTTGYTNLFISYVFTNSTGTTTLTVEGSFDGSTQETDITYAAVGATPATVAVLHPFIRFRLVQATADATRTKAFAQARALWLIFTVPPVTRRRCPPPRIRVRRRSRTAGRTCHRNRPPTVCPG